jgi:hypothetical protein
MISSSGHTVWLYYERFCSRSGGVALTGVGSVAFTKFEVYSFSVETSWRSFTNCSFDFSARRTDPSKLSCNSKTLLKVSKRGYVWMRTDIRLHGVGLNSVNSRRV